MLCTEKRNTQIIFRNETDITEIENTLMVLLELADKDWDGYTHCKKLNYLTEVGQDSIICLPVVIIFGLR